jgi:hypothetical protein
MRSQGIERRRTLGRGASEEDSLLLCWWESERVEKAASVLTSARELRTQYQ